jgi:hypothetical protein
MLPRWVKLEAGERVVWCSGRRFQQSASQGQLLSLMVLGVFGMFLVIPMAIFFGMAISKKSPWLLIALGAVVACAVSLVVRWFRRPTYFLTTHYLRIPGWLISRAFPLAGLVRVERDQRVVSAHGGRETVDTGKLVLTFSNGARPIVAPQDREGLWDLLYGAVLSRSLHLGALPGLDGSAGSAELRPDLFVAKATFTEGDRYGPIVIGPTRVIRFTEPLPTALQARLFTLVASATNAEAIEALLETQLVRHPDAGHSSVQNRNEITLQFAGKALTVSSQGQSRVIEFSPADAARCAAFFAPARSAYR